MSSRFKMVYETDLCETCAANFKKAMEGRGNMHFVSLDLCPGCMTKVQTVLHSIMCEKEKKDNA